MAKIRSPEECNRITTEFADRLAKASKHGPVDQIYFDGIDIYMTFVDSAAKWLEREENSQKKDHFKLFGWYDVGEEKT